MANLKFGPELMVIGDSVAQGCRSLTVNGALCAQSYPATLARLAGISGFASPKHPRPVMIDLEDIASNLIGAGLNIALGGIGANYAGWLADFGVAEDERPVAFDNLAVAGTTLEDLAGEDSNPKGDPPVGKPALAKRYLDQSPKFDIFDRADRARLSNLHLAVNARYVLNPSNDPDHMGFSMLDWVFLRQPQNLILHAGHNNGFYPIGSRGDTSLWKAQWIDEPRPALAKYLQNLDQLEQALPQTRILVLGLPKLGAVSNLMPDRDEGPHTKFPDYWETYWSVFPSAVRVPGSILKETDDEVAGINSILAEAVRSTVNRRKLWRYYSVYEFFDRYDTKNLLNQRESLNIGNYTITNNYIDADRLRKPGPRNKPPEFRWKFREGGFQSIDGMHPSLVGYTLLACELVEWLTGQPLSQSARDRELKSAVEKERLIQTFPPGLKTILRKVRKTDEGQPEEPDDEALAASVRQLR